MKKITCMVIILTIFFVVGMILFFSKKDELLQEKKSTMLNEQENEWPTLNEEDNPGVWERVIVLQITEVGGINNPGFFIAKGENSELYKFYIEYDTQVVTDER